MSRVSFSEWLAPFEARAKGRCKITNKNKKKLNSLYISWYLDTYGNNFNNLFRAIYSESLSSLIPSGKTILQNLFEKKPIWNMAVPIKLPTP